MLQGAEESFQRCLWLEALGVGEINWQGESKVRHCLLVQVYSGSCPPSDNGHKEERFIAAKTKTLKNYEQRYCSTKGELLALIQGLTGISKTFSPGLGSSQSQLHTCETANVEDNMTNLTPRLTGVAIRDLTNVQPDQIAAISQDSSQP